MGGQLSPDMLAVVVCDKMRWTFQEYQDQPEYFVRLLLTKWEEDAIKNKDTK